MQWSRIRQLANQQSMSAALASGCLGVLITRVDELLHDSPVWLWALIVGIIIGSISFIVAFMRQRVAIKTIIQGTRTLVTAREQNFHARKGLITFVGLYKPNEGSLGAKLTVDEQRSAAENLEFEKISFNHSNLKPVISSIVCHKERLAHCWLISTAGEDGSYVFAKMLASYLKDKEGLTCKFHFEADKFAVELEPNETVHQKTYELVDSILNSGTLAPKDIVADITTAPRSMALGMTLACLDKERDLQFMGTKYDRNSRPVGGLIPMIYSFEPKLEQLKEV